MKNLFRKIESWNCPDRYRMVVFTEKGKERYKLGDFVALCMSRTTPTPTPFHLWQRGDGSDKWALTHASFDAPCKETSLVEDVSLCYLACWMAKEYRRAHMGVGCFVEEQTYAP